MKAVMRRFISVWIMVSFLMCSAWGTASAGFSDVELTDWFFDGINFVSATNIIEAEIETEFGVDRAATRGMVAEALWKLEGCFDAEGETQSEKAVAWAMECGLYNGYDNGEKGIDDSVTREQLMTFLYRYATVKGYGDSIKRDISAFADADAVSDYAKDAAGWAIAKGIIIGKEDKKIDPQGGATVAELAVILERLYRCGFTEAAATEKKEYSVTDDNVRILGRGEVKDGARTFNWPNAGVEFEFTGSEADVYAAFSTNDDVTVNGSFFNMALYNGDELVRVERMKLTGGWNIIYKERSGDPEVKKIMLVRSSEACRGTIAISKLRCDGEPSATEPREKLIEYIGDSYTAGYANSPELSEHKWYCAENTDNWNSFTGMVARHYGADNNVIAYQGKGVYANRSLEALENTMSHQFMYSEIYTDGNAEGINMSTKAEHSFGDYSPQLVVIWLGTNDEAAPVDEETFKTAYEKLMGNVREKYPDAHILNMALENSLYLEEITEVAEKGDDKCHMLVLNKFITTFSAHPDIEEDERIAKQIIEKIDSIPDVWGK